MFLLACTLAWAQGQAGKPAAADSPLGRCGAANRDALDELGQALQAAHDRHRLNPVLVSRLRTLEADLGGLRARLPRDSRNLRDCEQLTAAIAAEQERLPRIAGPEPVVAECMAGNALAHREALQAYESLIKAAAGKPARLQPAQAALSRLGDLRPALGREGQTLLACRQLTATLAQERAEVNAIAALDPAADAAALDNCRSLNVEGYGDASRAWREAAAARGLKAGHSEFDAAMARLRKLRDDVAHPNFTLRDCEALSLAIAQERGRAGATAPPAAGAGRPAPAPIVLPVAIPVSAASRPAASAPVARPQAAASAASAAPAASPPGVAAQLPDKKQ